ncbi:MAG TPA: enolase C-terminal domain-like protein, partial [Geminicoccaceae bacterium]|nr:enolase C-terminal domain-like protein [Geminicoccaceae bacterium]
MSRIARVEVHPFTYEVRNLSFGRQRTAGVGNLEYAQGGSVTMSRYAVAILTDDGLRGEYVTHWVGTPAALGQTLMLAPHLVGRDAEAREEIYDDLKRELRAWDHMGHGPLDIALWDLAGRKYGAPVARLLGGYRTRLPTYASTYHGQDEAGGLHSPQAFADFAAHCQELGFAGFKIHGWHDGDARREVENLLGVRGRVGDDMALMIDPACELRTFMDALYVGRACDEADYFWYEDPYRDAAVSAFGHKRLREK